MEHGLCRTRNVWQPQQKTELTTSARQKLQPLQAISIADSARPSFEIVTFQL